MLLLLLCCTGIMSYKVFHRGITASPKFSSRYSRMFAAKSKSKFIDSATSWEDASDGITLVIVESPAKARTIQKFVDEGSFIIDSCAGRIITLKLLSFICELCSISFSVH